MPVGSVYVRWFPEKKNFKKEKKRVVVEKAAMRLYLGNHNKPFIILACAAPLYLKKRGRLACLCRFIIEI